MLGNSHSGAERTRKQRIYAALAVAAILAMCMWYYSSHKSPVSPGGSRLTNLVLSTKTPYLAPNATARSVPAGLELIQVQHIYRHGARYPTLGDMAHIKNVYGLGGLNVPRDWINAGLVDGDKAALLAEYGYHEMKGLAQRTLQRYPKFLAERMRNPELVRFVSSEFQRSIMSARTFQGVVDPSNHTRPVTVLPLQEDTILAMKTGCPVWVQGKETATLNASKETAVFDSAHGQKLIQRMEGKLGAKLTVDHISTLYSMCGYEVSLFAQSGTWCTLFDPDTSALMELRNDIKYSRVYGPFGANINRKLACALFTAIFQDIDSALRDPPKAVSTFRFGHAETIMFVSTLLRLEDVLGTDNSPITGSMPFSRAQHRGFKTSVIAPFSTNLGIELYRDQRDQPFFRMLLNEQSVRLPECHDEFCSLGVLRNKLSDAIGCDFESVCRISSR
ncbi:hypothetical protein GGI18_000014 [Coemansia linderi]|uniref:Uncharacterized protein n=1 Tax=Coemansia linderi TaxID=2663919 RepID=A0ACC1KPH2_9FUNG|nr:hypothetical protein GGI18_000014 [Coemansia linderi]